MSEIIYEPKSGNVTINSCVNFEEYQKICAGINDDGTLTANERKILKLLATRFLIFKYEKIADYYAVAEPNVRNWLEKLRCVIVDENKAIENGYFKYVDDYKRLLEKVVKDA